MRKFVSLLIIHVVIIVCLGEEIRHISGSLQISNLKHNPFPRILPSLFYSSESVFFVFGGYGCTCDDFGFSSDLWKFDGNTKRWVRIVKNEFNLVFRLKQGNAQPRVPSSRLGSSVWYDENLKKSVIYGGIGHHDDTSITSLPDIWIFNGETEVFEKQYISEGVKSLSLSAPLHIHKSQSLLSEYYYLYGGMEVELSSSKRSCEISGDLIRIRITSESTFSLEPVQIESNQPPSRIGFAFWELEEEFYISGGYTVNLDCSTGSHFGDIWKFDKTTFLWEEIETYTTKTTKIANPITLPPPTKYSTSQSISSQPHQIKYFGGTYFEESYDEIENYYFDRMNSFLLDEQDWLIYTDEEQNLPVVPILMSFGSVIRLSSTRSYIFGGSTLRVSNIIELLDQPLTLTSSEYPFLNTLYEIIDKNSVNTRSTSTKMIESGGLGEENYNNNNNNNVISSQVQLKKKNRIIRTLEETYRFFSSSIIIASREDYESEEAESDGDEMTDTEIILLSFLIFFIVVSIGCYTSSNVFCCLFSCTLVCKIPFVSRLFGLNQQQNNSQLSIQNNKTDKNYSDESQAIVSKYNSSDASSSSGESLDYEKNRASTSSSKRKSSEKNIIITANQQKQEEEEEGEGIRPELKIDTNSPRRSSEEKKKRKKNKNKKKRDMDYQSTDQSDVDLNSSGNNNNNNRVVEKRRSSSSNMRGEVVRGSRRRGGGGSSSSSSSDHHRNRHRRNRKQKSVTVKEYPGSLNGSRRRVSNGGNEISALSAPIEDDDTDEEDLFGFDSSSSSDSSMDDDDGGEDVYDAPFCPIPQDKGFDPHLIVKRGYIISRGSYGQIQTAYVDLGESKPTKVALKIVPIRTKHIQEVMEREVRIMKGLKNQFLLNCFGSFIEQNSIVIVTEFCEEGDLFSLKDQLPLASKLILIQQIAHGMHYLHGMNIVHRDLKNQNILLCRGKVRICDFGTSRDVGSITNTFVGTVEYLATEVIRPSYLPKKMRNNKEYTKLIDIYSYGVLIWELLVGKQPYIPLRIRCRNNQYEMIKQIHKKHLRPNLNDLPVSEEYGKELNGLKKLMINCWNKNPLERPKSFQEIISNHFPQIYKSIEGNGDMDPNSGVFLMKDEPSSHGPKFE